MKRLPSFLALAVVLALAQDPFPPRFPGKEEPPVKLPNGKLQRDEIIKADHKKSIEEAQELAKLASELREELDSSDSFVVSVKTLKKLDSIEKLTRNIRGRLKKY